MMAYTTALEKVVSRAKGAGSEPCPIADACSRVLAADVKAKMDSPPFDRAAMDGYAIRASDTFSYSEGSPVRLQVLEDVVAGTMPVHEIVPGTAAYVTTGAPIPHGADSVVMQEYAMRDGGHVELFTKTFPAKHVSRRGEDVRKNELVISRGTILRPQHVALLASLGIDQVSVARLLEVGIVVTGSELEGKGALTGGASIHDSNSHMLISLVGSSHAHVSSVAVAPDDAHAVLSAIADARAVSDIVLVTGGSSFGAKDVVSDVAGTFLFHGVEIKPGKPFGFIDGDVPLFIMSGYPVAAFFQYYLFVVPFLEASYSARILVREKASMAEPVASALGRNEAIRCRLEGAKAYPVRLSGSSMIRSLTLADGYIVIPRDKEGVNEGEDVDVTRFL